MCHAEKPFVSRDVFVADRVQRALVQLLLFDAQLTHPGQQLRGRNEQTSAQQESKHVGFLSKDKERHLMGLGKD